jgi:GTP cyclohydrolase I
MELWDLVKFQNCGCFCQKNEVQERLTDQIKRLYSRGLKPISVAVVIEAQHADEEFKTEFSNYYLLIYRCI